MAAHGRPRGTRGQNPAYRPTRPSPRGGGRAADASYPRAGERRSLPEPDPRHPLRPRARRRWPLPWQADEAPDPRLLVLNEPLAAELGLDPDWLRSPDGRAACWSAPTCPTARRPVAQAYAGHQFGGYVAAARRRAGAAARRARRRRRPACATCTSRAPGAPRSPAAATGWPRSARCCASTSSARRCTRSASRPPARSPSWRPAARCTARRCCPAPCSPGSRAATCGSAASSTPRATGDADLLRRLADHAIARHHPAAAGAEQPYLALFEAVVAAQASLVARWMLVGFVHGVMNTDNMTISGETIDYGPCAFLDAFDPATVFSSIDHGGRYAYGNQPLVAEWNLARLAEALLPLLADDQEQAVALAVEALGGFRPAVRRRLVGRHAGQARPARRPGRRRDRGAGRRPARPAAGRATSTTRRSSAPRRGRPRRRRAGSRDLFLDLAGVRRLGAAVAGAGPGRRRAWTGSTPSTSRATTWSRRRSPPRPPATSSRFGRLLEAVTAPVRRAAGPGALRRAGARRTSAPYRTFCGT